MGGQPQDGRGIGWGDHFLPHKFIKRSSECWATSTKQLLKVGGGHQTPRKAAHSLWEYVGQNIKVARTKYKRQKQRKNTYRWRFAMRRESWKRRSFHTVGNLLICMSVESFGISEGNITRSGVKLTEYASRCNDQQRSGQNACVCYQWKEAGQGGMGCITDPYGKDWFECLEDNLREIMWESNPNLGIARETKKKTFPTKGSNPWHNHRTKDWGNTKGE